MSRRKAALLVICAVLWAIVHVNALQPPMASYAMSSGVGYRVKPMGGGEEALHRGVDLVGPPLCAILAAAPGVVVEHWPVPGTPRAGGGVFRGHPIYGGMIVLDHGNGVFTIYGHMSRTYVHTGMRVLSGQIIGRQGSTGISTGQHLHFELVVNPLMFFEQPYGLADRAMQELRR